MSVRKLSDDKLAELRLTVRLRKESGFQAALPVILMQRRLAEFFGPLAMFIVFIRQSCWSRASAGAGRGSWPRCSRRWRPITGSSIPWERSASTRRMTFWPWASSRAPACSSASWRNACAARASAKASSTSFVELLGEEAGPSLDDPGRLYVRNISEAARRMGHLSVTYQCIEAAAGVNYNTILGPMA